MPARARSWLAAAGGCAFVAVLTYLVAFHTGHGISWDARGLHALMRLDTPHGDRVLNAVASLCNPIRYTLLAGAVLIWCLLARGPRAAVTMATAVGVAVAASRVLKPLLSMERGDPYNVVAASWPSGHSCAAAILTLVALYAAPPRLRSGVAVIGAAFCAGVGVAVVALGWHYPSDVVGGYALAGAVWSLAQARLQLEPRWDAPGDQSTSSSPLAPRDRMKSRSESRLR